MNSTPATPADTSLPTVPAPRPATRTPFTPVLPEQTLWQELGSSVLLLGGSMAATALAAGGLTALARAFS